MLIPHLETVRSLWAMNHPHVHARDALGEEREKMGTGKKLERTLFFPFWLLHFLTTFFPVFGENRQKRVNKGMEQRKQGWKHVERRRTAIPHYSKLSNLARFRFLCRLKHVSAPIPTPFLPLSKPILDPFPHAFLSLSCTAKLSYLDARQLHPNHWTTLDHHRSADQWEVCVQGEETLGTSLRNMFAPTRGSKWSDATKKARA